MEDNDDLFGGSVNEPSIGSKPRRRRKAAAAAKTSDSEDEGSPPAVAPQPAAPSVPAAQPKVEAKKSDPAVNAKPPAAAPTSPPAPTTSAAVPAGPVGAPEAQANPAEGLKKINSLEDMDELLEQVDPGFMKDLKSINPADFSSLSIQDDQTEQADENIVVKHLRLQWFQNLPTRLKIVYLGSIGIVAFFAPIFALILTGNFIPEFAIPYTLSMNELSQKVYTYDPDGPTVPLFDDFKTKAFTLSLPRMSVNLKQMGDQPAHGQFEFFIVVRDKELGTIIENDRAAVIDLIRSTLEQVTWNDMQSPIGKEKVKKILRHMLNEHFQSNIVTSVYYRSILVSK